jgi:hypothetical protein
VLDVLEDLELEHRAQVNQGAAPAARAVLPGLTYRAPPLGACPSRTPPAPVRAEHQERH